MADGVGGGVAKGDALGGSVVGGAVLTRGLALSGLGNPEADAEADGEGEPAPARPATFRKTAAATTIVARLPATAASPRSM